MRTFDISANMLILLTLLKKSHRNHRQYNHQHHPTCFPYSMEESLPSSRHMTSSKSMGYPTSCTDTYLLPVARTLMIIMIMMMYDRGMRYLMIMKLQYHTALHHTTHHHTTLELLHFIMNHIKAQQPTFCILFNRNRSSLLKVAGWNSS